MSSQDLKDKTVTGLFWGGVSNGLLQLLNLFFGIFLARLLSPADYGMVGMLTVFSSIASALQESGFTAALANKEKVEHRDYNAVFWFSVLVSAVLYIILFMCAPFIARFYGILELTALARYSFLSIFIVSLGVAQGAFLFRNLRVKQKAISSVLAVAVSGTVGVIMAFNGFAYWGIATQGLVYVSVNVLCYWFFSSWRPTFHFDFRPLRGMIVFSSKLLVTNVFNQLNNNLFNVVLGKFYSGKEVGFFSQANKWNLMGHSLISGMVNGVAQPVLVQVGNERSRQIRVFRKMLRFTSFVSFPCMFGLSLVAPELITIAVTDKWASSASLMHYLCIGGAFIPINMLYSNLLVSKGRSGIYMWNTIALGMVQLIVVLLLYPYGIHVMTGAYVCIQVGWLLVWHYFVWREIGLKFLDAMKDIAPYAVIAGGVMGMVYYATLTIQDVYWLFLVKVVVAVLLYVVLMWLSDSVTFRETVEYARRKIQG